jgi:hypothetical protein
VGEEWSNGNRLEPMTKIEIETLTDSGTSGRNIVDSLGRSFLRGGSAWPAVYLSSESSISLMAIVLILKRERGTLLCGLRWKVGASGVRPEIRTKGGVNAKIKRGR